VDYLVDLIDRFRRESKSVEARRRTRAAAHLQSVVAAKLMRQVEARVPAAAMDALIDRVAARTVDPYSAADEVLSSQ
jgi:putative protein kinase ArgK-like GTPase of G3E family